MNRLSVRTLTALAALVLLSYGHARAELVDFGYAWTVEPTAVIPGGTGSVTLAVAPDGTAQVTAGSAVDVSIPGATVTTTSSAVSPPDQFDTAFSMKLTLTDTASGTSGLFTFSGHLSGELTSTTSTLEAQFTDPVTQTLTLGAHEYTVTINPTLLGLPIPGSATPAEVKALVKVSGVPEPSSLALGSAALALCGVFARRRRHR